MLVDWGLFQGYKQLRWGNWAPLPFEAAHMDAVILTHARTDHSGHLQEEEADFANCHKTSKHAPALPLYTRDDAERCPKLFHCVPAHGNSRNIPAIFS